MKNFILTIILLTCLSGISTAQNPLLIDESFEGSFLPSGWSRQPTSGKTWEQTTSTASDGSASTWVNTDGPGNASAFLISPPVSLTADKPYLIFFDQRVGSSALTEDLYVQVYKADLTVKYFDGAFVNLVNTSWLTREYQFTPTITQNYRIVFACGSLAYGAGLYIDDVELYGPSVHDDCANAITLTPYSGPTCGAVTNGATYLTTESLAGCSGKANDDVWYKFVATSTSHTITVTGKDGFDAVLNLRSGACNGSSISCTDATGSNGIETVTYNSFVVGQTYYVRVYDWYTNLEGPFDICITTPTVTNTFTGTGDWSNTARWSKGTVPLCSEDAIIAAGANCNLPSGTATTKNLTISGNFTINGGTLTTGCSSGGGNTIFYVDNSGTFNMTNGTLNINGRFEMSEGGSHFSQSGGNINIDPNSGSPATSVEPGKDAMYLVNAGSGHLSLSGGNITILDPCYNLDASVDYSSIPNAGLKPTGNHTFIFGGGSHGSNPFILKTLGGYSLLAFNNMTVSGGARFVQPFNENNNIVVFNNLTINSGSELRANSNVNVAYNLTNNGTLTTLAPGTLGAQSWDVNNDASAQPTTDPVSIQGSGIFRNAYSVTPTASTDNLTINVGVSGGATFTMSDFSVAQTLKLTDGVLNIGGGTITLGTSTSNVGTLTGGSSDSYIAGKFKRWINAAVGPRLFPVGNTSDYYPANINYTAAPAGGTLTAQFIDGDAGSSGLPLTDGSGSKPYANYLCTTGYWQMDAGNGLSGGTYTASMTGTGFGCVDDYSTVRLLKRAGSGNDWALQGTFAAGTGSNSIPTANRTGMNGFSQFAISQGQLNPLPVELTKFSGIAREKKNILSWQTASEINSDKFYLERSHDGHHATFATIGSVDAKGNTNTESNYEYTDENPLTASYYRLKMVDLDGSYEYSKIILLRNNEAQDGDVHVYPVPAHNSVTLQFTSAYSDEMIAEILDMNGRVVKQVKFDAVKGTNQKDLDISQLAPGMYHMHIYGGSIDKNIRIVRQ